MGTVIISGKTKKRFEEVAAERNMSFEELLDEMVTKLESIIAGHGSGNLPTHAFGSNEKDWISITKIKMGDVFTGEY